MVQILSAALAPALMLLLFGLCLGTEQDAFSLLTQGAVDGLRTAVRLAPTLITLMTLVTMLRASGAMALLENLLAAYQPEYIWAPEDQAGEFPGMAAVYEACGYALLKTGYIVRKVRRSLHEKMPEYPGQSYACDDPVLQHGVRPADDGRRQ